MRIVVEKYPYEYSSLVKALPGFNSIPLPDDNGLVRMDYVGYCFLPEANDCVFFLPKVVLKPKKKESESSNVTLNDEQTGQNKEEVTTNDWIFGEHDPKTLLIVDESFKIKNETQYKFLYELSVWIYRAIKEFKRLNPDSEIVTRQNVSFLDNTQNIVEGTFIDILLSLIKFNKDNQDFFMFIVKNIHSGYNKINWRKTIATKQPIIQDDSPIYMNPVNKKKQINFDEELLIIFFSILNYIKEHYGFPVIINFNYELITGELFAQYRDFYGVIRLKQIKYKYFSDKALKLWNLCYAFFEQSSQIKSSSCTLDFLIAYKFENIFEAIIDELIGQHNLPQKLKEQKDGKIIDHLFRYSDLVHRLDNSHNEVYYIGDSKYYKIGASVGENSIYKQYTYAKNVIQYDFDLFFEKEKRKEEFKKNHIGYHDPLTEGYNITPNFFISAEIDSNFSFDEQGLKSHLGKDGKPVQHLNRHFNNRLFDRDTLWISHYDINFLFILALYGRGNDYAKTTFRNDARKLFRDAVIAVLKKQYEFFTLKPIDGLSLEEAVTCNFKKLLGKIYRPSGCDYLILALQKGEQYNDSLIALVDTLFIRNDYDLNA